MTVPTIAPDALAAAQRILDAAARRLLAESQEKSGSRMGARDVTRGTDQ